MIPEHIVKDKLAEHKRALDIKAKAGSKSDTKQQPHGHGIRGISGHHNLHQLGGKFFRLFPKNNSELADDVLLDLANSMIGDGEVKDTEDPEESHIPAAYTYFGQFVDHDITFDPETFAQQQADPKGITNFRSPAFDLDNVYGRGPSDQPYLYDGKELMLGSPLVPVPGNEHAFDVPRAHANSMRVRRAIIGDPRNDENVIVSQLQGLVLKFHNFVVAQNPNLAFDAAQQIVRWHYQWIVIHDWLPRIVRSDILDKISPAIRDTSKNFLSHPPNFLLMKESEPKLPVEFSVAAYRLGHSMVRPGYRLNSLMDAAQPIFDPNDSRDKGLNGFRERDHRLTIDWNRLIPLDQSSHDFHMQRAYKIDTSLVLQLSTLPPSVAGDEANADTLLKMLAYRNLKRGQILALPFGQTVARLMGLTPLDDEDIIIGPAEKDSGPMTNGKTIIEVNSRLAGRCPLWVYILAESRKNFYDNGGEARLGDVGGRIVAETFMSLLMLDEDSYIREDPYWRPNLGGEGAFSLADLIRIATSYDPGLKAQAAAVMQ